MANAQVDKYNTQLDNLGVIPDNLVANNKINNTDSSNSSKASEATFYLESNYRTPDPIDEGTIDLTPEIITDYLIGKGIGKVVKPLSGVAQRGIESLASRYAVQQAAKRIIIFSEQKLQKKFKHAIDFGIIGNYSRANAAKFQEVLTASIKNPYFQLMKATYRQDAAKIYYNPITRQAIILKPNGEFISAWKLDPDQVYYLYKKGNLN